MIKNTSRLIFWLVVCVAISVAAYSILNAGGADDAAFLAIVLLVSTLVSLLASPDQNIVVGLKRLWLMDWIPVIAIPIVIISVMPPDSVFVVATRFFCLAWFLLGGAITTRRFLKGRT